MNLFKTDWKIKFCVIIDIRIPNKVLLKFGETKKGIFCILKISNWHKWGWYWSCSSNNKQLLN